MRATLSINSCVCFALVFQTVLPNIKVHAYFAPVTPPVGIVAGKLRHTALVACHHSTFLSSLARQQDLDVQDIVAAAKFFEIRPTMQWASREGSCYVSVVTDILIYSFKHSTFFDKPQKSAMRNFSLPKFFVFI
jgi:hypothetical protein